MGLDMYLTAKRHFYDRDWVKDNTEREINRKIREMIPEIKNIDTGNLNYISVAVEVGYWRKANQIHMWFVDNIQDGDDNCREHYVDKDKLIELREICQTIIDKTKLIDGIITNGYKIAGITNGEVEKIPMTEAGRVIEDSTICKRLLPTTEGFFFGNQDYDDWYYEQIEETIRIIDRCLSLPEAYDFYYQSSW